MFQHLKRSKVAHHMGNLNEVIGLLTLDEALKRVVSEASFSASQILGLKLCIFFWPRWVK